MEVENGNNGNGMMMPQNNWPSGPTTLAAVALGGLLLGGAGLMGLGGRGNGGPNLAQENSALMAENAQLKAQSYTDGKYAALLEKSVKNEADLANLREITALQTKNAQLETAAGLTAQINAVAIAGVQTAGVVAQLQQTVNNLTQVVVPSANILPPPAPPVAASSSTSTSTANG